MKQLNDKHRKKIGLLLIIVPFALVGLFLFTRYKNIQVATVTEDSTSKSQFDQSLPEPNLKKEQKTKLELYMQAMQDSAKHKADTVEKVPRFFNPGPPPPAEEVFAPTEPIRRSQRLAQQEKKVNAQLDQLMQQLQQPDKTKPGTETGGNYGTPSTTPAPDIARLEALLQSLQHSKTAPDPEMQTLNEVLSKLIDLNSPDKPTSSLPKTATDSNRLRVTTSPQASTGKSLFYTLRPPTETVSKQKPAIKASVHGDQTIVSGANIKLRLLENIYIGQALIPANNIIEGTCSISGERVLVSLEQISSDGVLYPIHLEVYDTYGLPGIHIQGTITHDAATQSLNQGAQSVNIGSLDPSVAGQMTSAGIQGIKSLFSRKAALIKATVKSGYLVYLQ